MAAQRYSVALFALIPSRSQKDLRDNQLLYLPTSVTPVEGIVRATVNLYPPSIDVVEELWEKHTQAPLYAYRTGLLS